MNGGLFLLGHGPAVPGRLREEHALVRRPVDFHADDERAFDAASVSRVSWKNTKPWLYMSCTIMLKNIWF